jgi:mono/diheme cytochrome c family protein
MSSTRSIGLIASAIALATTSLFGAAGGDDKTGHTHQHAPPGTSPAHVHAPVPAEYQQIKAPVAVWTDAAVLARGRAIYTAKCALCHGDQGAGDGPVAKALPLKPASFKDTAMVAEMSDSFWFWRVSEGAAVEPYRSAGSVMPAWKDELSVDDRWAVIAYQHSLSGHRGPHVPSEHPELKTAGPRSHPEFRGVGFTSPWVTRDHRAQPRGPWRYALRKELPALYREMNGIDFGHAHLGETLLKTQDADAVERARLEVLDFIFSSPSVPPDEEQIAPVFSRLAPEVGKTFDWAHVFHRSLYDLFASDVADKEAAYRRLLADYLEKPEAITPHRLDHHQALWSFAESKSFRDRFRKFNTQIWAYHWLQASVYDVQLLGDAGRQRELMPKIIAHYHGYLRQPPVEWQFMPMMPEGAPLFAQRFPEAAAIFDNLHMLHDNFDDVLVRPDLYPTMAARREAILKILPVYLHRSHGANDLYSDFHEPAAGAHGGHGGMDMGPRPPSAGDVLADRTPRGDHHQRETPRTPAGEHKH